MAHALIAATKRAMKTRLKRRRRRMRLMRVGVIGFVNAKIVLRSKFKVVIIIVSLIKKGWLFSQGRPFFFVEEWAERKARDDPLRPVKSGLPEFLLKFACRRASHGGVAGHVYFQYRLRLGD